MSTRSNLLVSSLLASFLITSHRNILYVNVMLHLVIILIDENVFLWQDAAASSVLTPFAVFDVIFLFQFPKQLLHHSLLVSLITTTLFFTTLLLRILQNLGVFWTAPLVLHSVSHSVPLLISVNWLPVQSGIISYQTIFPRTYVSIFHNLSTTQAQSPLFTWFSLPVSSQG